MTAIESIWNSVATEICRQPWEVAGITVAYVGVCAVVIYRIDCRWRRKNRRDRQAEHDRSYGYVPSNRPLEPPTRDDLPVWVDDASLVRSLPLTVAEMVRELDDGEPVIDALLGEMRLRDEQ